VGIGAKVLFEAGKYTLDLGQVGIGLAFVLGLDEVGEGKAVRLPPKGIAKGLKVANVEADFFWQEGRREGEVMGGEPAGKALLAFMAT